MASAGDSPAFRAQQSLQTHNGENEAENKRKTNMNYGGRKKGGRRSQNKYPPAPLCGPEAVNNWFEGLMLANLK